MSFARYWGSYPRLIYEVKLDWSGEVSIGMNFTAPNCSAASCLPLEVKGEVRALPQGTRVELGVVWELPWDLGPSGGPHSKDFKFP